MKKLLVCATFALFSSLSYANHNDKTAEALLTSLVNCDSRFFSTIYQHQNELAQFAPIQQINQQKAYFVVKDRQKSPDNYISFNTPLHFNDIAITGYYDSAMNLGKYGDYYFWGLTIESDDIVQVKNVLSFVDWKEMEKNQLYIANTKIRQTGDSIEHWRDNTEIEMGVKTVPLSGTAEKLLLLEKTPGTVTLYCSIQGFLPPELLAIERPDLPKAEY